MNVLSKELEAIAKNYHLSSKIKDKFIEDACQEYCCDWLESLINENHNVLELGYGEGHTCNRLSKKTKTYSIIEGSSDLLDEVKSKHPEVNLIDDLFEEYQSILDDWQASFKEKPVYVSEKDIQEVISSKTSIPISIISSS